MRKGSFVLWLCLIVGSGLIDILIKDSVGVQLVFHVIFLFIAIKVRVQSDFIQYNTGYLLLLIPLLILSMFDQDWSYIQYEIICDMVNMLVSVLLLIIFLK